MVLPAVRVQSAIMNVPTESEKFSELVEHLRKAAEAAYMIGHLRRDSDEQSSHGFLGIGQLLERIVIQVTALATKGRFN